MTTKIYFDKEKHRDLFDKYLSNLKQEIKKTRVLENAYITNAGPFSIYNAWVDAGVYSENKELYLESTQNDYELNIKLDDDIEFVNKDVIYCGVLSPHYGHFLIESTVRLYYYLQNRGNDSYIVFSKLVDYIPKFAQDFFKLLEIPEDKIIYVDKPTQFKSVTIPYKSFTRRREEYYTEEFLYPFLVASKNIKPAKFEKIFFSRKNWNGVAKCLGENDLEKVFNKNGFVSIAMEKLSLKEQIAVIKGAKEIAGINGTAFHNIIFASEHKTLIMLNRNEETDCQYMINQATKANCYLIKAYENPLPVNHAHGPFIVGATLEFKDFAKKYGLKDYEISFNPKKYLTEFLEKYFEVYARSNFYDELVANRKNLIDTSLFIKFLNYRKYSRIKHLVFYILSKITFGNLRKNFKEKRNIMRNLKNINIEFKY